MILSRRLRKHCKKTFNGQLGCAEALERLDLIAFRVFKWSLCGSNAYTLELLIYQNTCRIIASANIVSLNFT